MALGEEPPVQEATEVYRVVRNDEEQYSIWRADRECPPGWHDEGTSGSRDECLRHIDEVWTDITPLSVRLARASRRDDAA